jgi:hypothetical protein
MKTKISKATAKRMQEQGAKRILKKASAAQVAAKKREEAELAKRTHEQQQIELLRAGLESVMASMEKTAERLGELEFQAPEIPEITVTQDPRPVVVRAKVVDIERDAQNRIGGASFEFEYNDLH